MRVLVPGLLLWLLGTVPAAGQPTQGGPLPGPLPLFPAANWWNLDVTHAPLDANGQSFIDFIGGSTGLHPDFGGDSDPSPEIYGMPYIVVPGTQPLEPVTFDYARESDAGAPGRPPGYPIPVEAKTQPHWIEGGYAGNVNVGGDKHVLIVDKDNRLLFETWNTRCLPYGSSTCSWRAGSGAVFPLDSNLRRTDGWTSADAAGLAILPGLVRYDEAYGTAPIQHAFRFTAHATNGYVYPASHTAGSTSGAPPMGTRLRLKASKDTSRFSPEVQRIFQSLKTYGLILADNGSDMYIQGTYDTRWNNDVLNPAFGALHTNDFEVIQLGWTPPGPGPIHFYTAAPCRVVDTRNPSGPLGGPALAAGGTRTFGLAGTCGIPGTARSVSANITAVLPGAGGELIVYPGGGTLPLTSTISFATGQVRANNALLLLSSDGSGAVQVRNGSAGSVHMVIDVNGYFE